MTTTLIARTPDDLVAAIPIVLGFHPEHSIVMLTLVGPHRFHARLDLPAEPAQVALAVETLLGPALRNGVEQVAFVLYTPSRRLARLTADTLTGTFVEAGIEVADCLRAHRGRWFPASPRRHEAGTPYDAERHPFRAQAVFEGHVLYRSRAELAAQVAPDAEHAAAVAAQLDGATPLDGPHLWQLVERHLTAGTVPDAPDLAAMLVSLRDHEARDHGWLSVDRTTAHAHTVLWSEVLRRTPDDWAAEPGAVLALVAWLAGNGALAWCALDRCFAADPGHRIGLLVAQALTHAVPPTIWEQ
jgi:hypothetical protein